MSGNIIQFTTKSGAQEMLEISQQIARLQIRFLWLKQREARRAKSGKPGPVTAYEVGDTKIPAYTRKGYKAVRFNASRIERELQAQYAKASGK